VESEQFTGVVLPSSRRERALDSHVRLAACSPMLVNAVPPLPRTHAPTGIVRRDQLGLLLTRRAALRSGGFPDPTFADGPGIRDACSPLGVLPFAVMVESPHGNDRHDGRRVRTRRSPMSCDCTLQAPTTPSFFRFVGGVSRPCITNPTPGRASPDARAQAACVLRTAPLLPHPPAVRRSTSSTTPSERRPSTSIALRLSCAAPRRSALACPSRLDDVGSASYLGEAPLRSIAPAQRTCAGFHPVLARNAGSFPLPGSRPRSRRYRNAEAQSSGSVDASGANLVPPHARNHCAFGSRVSLRDEHTL